MTFYFVRHGRTNTNEEGLLIGQLGKIYLTDEAQTLAIELGGDLAGVNFDRVFCSSLYRAEQTAKLCLEGAGQSYLELKELDDLIDVSWGEAEEMTWEEVINKYQVTSIEECFGEIDDANF